MKKEWTPMRIVGLLLAIVALVCFLISMFQEGSKLFLNIGLVLTCVGLILVQFLNKK